MDIVTKETFKTKVQKLVEHFSDNEDYYKSTQYKEDHVRQEFINPFFKALGWDMDNEQGFAPQYREVIHEDRIEIEGKPKAPDYAFKVGSDRKFFVEAKASSVRVFSEIDPAFQLRRYAWSGQLPVSILTDFEEFSIYDTTLEPKHTDKSSVARVKYINYKDYLKEVDYLWDTFSKEAVWKGSFDKFAKREKKGSQLVDKSFLKEIELWRDLVAKDVASNNNLNIYELNSVVQKFIDRIIFLRIAEDRGVESYETLRSAVKSPDTYSQLLKIFSRADEKYNSSLFDLKKDELSTKIKISDKTLDRILNNLYYPKSPYEFSVIGVDILGSVYEQFLGKVIRLTKGGNAVIEEKPEVKKAGGVYYTPQYIVDYIIKNTVGELVKDKTPKDVAKLKVVDPACGSGSFLIGAYNYLLNWHHKYYVENDVEKNLKTKKLFKDGEGNYFLSTQEKKDILLNNIHGVDIDPQAVEVTKLSLALKMLEGENSETINAQYKLFADRILPDLSSNIKCGNSLIGSDYYSDKQITLLGDEELRKVNAFDWDKEFPFIFRSGGFDAVIGNPPYIRIQTIEKSFSEYFLHHYHTARGKYDMYSLFVEKALSLINKSGNISFILPNKFLVTDYGEYLREIIAQKECLKSLVNFKDAQVFENASTYTCILSLSGEKLSHFSYKEFTGSESNNNIIQLENLPGKSLPIPRDVNPWTLSTNEESIKVLNIAKKSSKLSDYTTRISQGIITGADKLFVFDKISEEGNYTKVKSSYDENIYQFETELLKPFLRGENIKAFRNKKPHKYILYPYYISNGNTCYYTEKDLSGKYPNIYKYLVKYRKILSERGTSGMKYPVWYALWNARDKEMLESRKILTPTIASKPSFLYDSSGEFYFLGSGAGGPGAYSVILKQDADLSYYFLLGLLNSEFVDIYIKSTSSVFRGGYYAYSQQFLKEIPIPDLSNKNLIKQISDLAEDLEKLCESLQRNDESNIKMDTIKNLIEKKSSQLNTMVYKIYCN